MMMMMKMMMIAILNALSWHILSHLILTTILKGRNFNYLHFADEEIEASQNS